jgi:hypothetical protein
MIDIDDVRRSLTGLADEARPATLGPAALGGARRRRRRQRIGVTALVLLLAGLLVPISVQHFQRNPAPPLVDIPSGPMRAHVITAYAADGGWSVLDAAHGRYRRVDGGSVASVSPNLQLYTDVSTRDGLSSVLRITTTAPDGPSTFLTIADWALVPQWSPDGTWLVVPVVKVSTDGVKPETGFTEIVLVDVLNAKMQRRKVDFGGGRTGSWVAWADDDTLLAGTERQRFQADGVARISRDGKVLSRYPLPAADCSDRVSTLPAIHDEKLLVCAKDGPAQVYRSFDASTGKTGPELGRIPVTADAQVEAVWWDGGAAPVMQVSDPTSDNGFYQARVALLGQGRLSDGPAGVPSTLDQLLIGSSDGLSGAGARLTF